MTVPASGTGSLVISGTPTAAGTETFTLTATDSLGAETSTNYSITVNAAPSLAPATLPADTVGVAYDQTITASGGTGTLTLAVSNIQGANRRPDRSRQRHGKPGHQRHAHGRRDRDVHRHRHRFAGRNNDHKLQHYGQSRRQPGSGDAAGRHDRRGLQPDDHRQRRHRHAHPGRERHPGRNRRPDRSRPAAREAWSSAARPRPPGPRRSPSPPPIPWARRPRNYSITVNPALSLARRRCRPTRSAWPTTRRSPPAAAPARSRLAVSNIQGANRRPDRSRQRHGKPGHQRHAHGRRDRDVHPHRHRFAWAQQRPRITASR